MITRLTVTNGKAEPLVVGIEPWADVETIPAHGRVDFEVINPTELEAGVNGDGTMTVGIIGNNIKLVSRHSVRRITDDQGEYAPRAEAIADSETWRAIWGAAPDKD